MTDRESTVSGRVRPDIKKRFGGIRPPVRQSSELFQADWLGPLHHDCMMPDCSGAIIGLIQPIASAWAPSRRSKKPGHRIALASCFLLELVKGSGWCR